MGKPPTRSALSAQDAAAVQHSALESDGSDDHDSGVELEQHLSPNLAKRKGVKHTSTSLAGHLIGGYGSSAALASIAQHARTSIRHGEDKVALAVTMYDWVYADPAYFLVATKRISRSIAIYVVWMPI